MAPAKHFSKDDTRYLTTAEAAHLLRVSERFLRDDRRSSDPQIPFIQLGPRLFRYPKLELLKLVESRAAATGE